MSYDKNIQLPINLCRFVDKINNYVHNNSIQ